MFLVCLQRYRLDEGRVGDPIGDPEVFSYHRSLRAAGRMLGSLISGKHRRYMRQAREGMALYAFDTDTGERFSRAGCETGEPMRYPPRAMLERTPA